MRIKQQRNEGKSHHLFGRIIGRAVGFDLISKGGVVPLSVCMLVGTGKFCRSFAPVSLSPLSLYPARISLKSLCGFCFRCSRTRKIFNDEEQIHFNYFDNIGGHIKELRAVYLAQIVGTPATTSLASKGFVSGPAGA
jgi:hypothetical protein